MTSSEVTINVNLVGVNTGTTMNGCTVNNTSMNELIEAIKDLIRFSNECLDK